MPLLLFTQKKKASSIFDPYLPSVAVLQQYENNVFDDVGNKVTVIGSVSYGAGTSGQAVFLATDADGLSLPANANAVFGTGDFTIECWIKTTQYGHDAYGYQLLDFRPDGANGLYPSLGLTLATQKIYWIVNNSTVYTGNSSVPFNTWTHLAVVRSSGITKFYINGVLDGSYADPNSYLCGQILIGLNAFRLPAPQTGFKGYIDGLRITKGVARYTSNFTPVKQRSSDYRDYDYFYGSNALLMHGNTLTDTVGKTVTVNGGASVSTSVSKFGSGSLKFTNREDYLSVPNSNDFNFGTQDFTIEFWLFTPVDWSAQPYGSTGLLGQKLNDTISGWVIYRDGNYPNKINARLGLSIPMFPTASSPTVNTWEHWALVRVGTTVSWYKNGILDATITGSGAISDTTAPFLIGRSQTWGGGLQGYLEDIRITKGVARYKSNFNVPERQLPNKPNRDLYWAYHN